jgi:hypothetical protein
MRQTGRNNSQSLHTVEHRPKPFTDVFQGKVFHEKLRQRVIESDGGDELDFSSSMPWVATDEDGEIVFESVAGIPEFPEVVWPQLMMRTIVAAKNRFCL